MIKVGDSVNYHSIVGGPVTSTGHKVESILRQPNDFGCDVAWISSKSGCVAIAALSNDANPMHPLPKPLTRSQKRYEAYLHSECGLSFIDWLRNDYWKDYRRAYER